MSGVSFTQAQTQMPVSGLLVTHRMLNGRPRYLHNIMHIRTKQIHGQDHLGYSFSVID